METAEIYRELAEEQPGVFRQRYMDYRGWLRRWLSERRDEAEAIGFDLPLRPGPGETSPPEDVE